MNEHQRDALVKRILIMVEGAVLSDDVGNVAGDEEHARLLAQQIVDMLSSHPDIIVLSVDALI